MDTFFPLSHSLTKRLRRRRRKRRKRRENRERNLEERRKEGKEGMEIQFSKGACSLEESKKTRKAKGNIWLEDIEKFKVAEIVSRTQRERKVTSSPWIYIADCLGVKCQSHLCELEQRRCLYFLICRMDVMIIFPTSQDCFKDLVINSIWST